MASQLGRADEASTSYQELLSKGQADENVLAVAQNNLLALQSDGHAHQKKFAGEAVKKLEALLDPVRLQDKRLAVFVPTCLCSIFVPRPNKFA